MIDIDNLKARLNIIDVIESLVPLKKAGKNYQACCPFHDEKSPSFTVSESKQFYHCFGCGAHGDAIGFIQEYYNIEFLDAAKMLGGESEDEQLIKAKPAHQAKIRLPLDKEPHSKDEINGFLTNKCELMNGHYLYNEYAAIKLTDINLNLISCALIRGTGFDNKYFKKEFLHGSCVIMGEIIEGHDVFLCENYQQTLQTRQLTNKTCICYFEPNNLYFIYDDLKRKTTSVAVVANSDESLIQADKLNLLNCYFKQYNNDNRVDLNNV